MNWLQVLRADPCCYCGEPGGSIDHIEPRSLGGSDDPSNLAGACRSCNSSKGTDAALHFMLRGRQGKWRGYPDVPAPMVQTLERVGHAMRGARRSHGITRQTLADRIGVSVQTVTRWESGKHAAVLRNLPRISAAFGRADWDWLLHGELIFPAVTDKAAA